MIGARRHPVQRAAIIGALVAVLATPFTASAASAADGTNWWYDRYGIPEIQTAGGTGAGVPVAVIDTQINPELPVFDGTPLTVDQTPGCPGVPVISTEATSDAVHGSDITALLIGNGTGTGAVRGIAPQASVTFYGTGTEDDACDSTRHDQLSSIGQTIDRAVAGGAKVISISLSVPDLNDADAGALARAISSGVIIVAGTSNTQLDPTFFPANANGVVSVNAFDAAGAIQLDHDDSTRTNAWPETTVVAAGVDFPSVNWQVDSTITGSSLATPLVAGMLAVTWQKYPDATANQLLQSLIRNTTTEDHPLRRDVTGGYGYGPASLRHLLAVDPSQYPDENPLLDKTSGVPTVAQIANGGEASASATPTSTEPQPTSTPRAAANSASSGILGGVVVAAITIVVLVAAVIIIVLLVRRRRATASKGNKP